MIPLLYNSFLRALCAVGGTGYSLRKQLRSRRGGAVQGGLGCLPNKATAVGLRAARSKYIVVNELVPRPQGDPLKSSNGEAMGLCFVSLALLFGDSYLLGAIWFILESSFCTLGLLIF